MGRFDRDETAGGLPASLGTATQSLRTTVEEKLREIVEAAEARAHEIEDRAMASALEIEQDSERKARTRFESTSRGAEELLGAIDAFEHDMSEAIRTLRLRGEALASQLEAAITTEVQPGDAIEPPAAPIEVAPVEVAPVEKGPVEEGPVDGDPVDNSTVQPTAEIEQVPAEPPPKARDDARESVRKRILDLFLSGKPRSEAELMLAQIEDGGRYTDLLDEIYEARSATQQGSSSRGRGGRRRRRPGG